MKRVLHKGLKPHTNVTIKYPVDPTGTLEGGKYTTVKGDLLTMAVGNSRQMGGMMNVCPDALLDDGLLDFTMMFGTLRQQVSLLDCMNLDMDVVS